jgi:hypothetical protein
MTHSPSSLSKEYLGSILFWVGQRIFWALMVKFTHVEPCKTSHESRQINALEDKLERLKDAMRCQSDKNVGNDLMFEKQQEETNAIMNNANEDGLVIIDPDTPSPDEPRFRIKALKTMATKIYSQLILSFDSKDVSALENSRVCLFRW